MYNETAEDKQWAADCDARTLSEAQIITGDETRMAAAKAAAEKLAEKSREEAKALANIDKVFTKQKSTDMYPNTKGDRPNV